MIYQVSKVSLCRLNHWVLLCECCRLHPHPSHSFSFWINQFRNSFLPFDIAPKDGPVVDCGPRVSCCRKGQMVVFSFRCVSALPRVQDAMHGCWSILFEVKRVLDLTFEFRISGAHCFLYVSLSVPWCDRSVCTFLRAVCLVCCWSIHLQLRSSLTKHRGCCLLFLKHITVARTRWLPSSSVTTLVFLLKSSDRRNTVNEINSFNKYWIPLHGSESSYCSQLQWRWLNLVASCNRIDLAAVYLWRRKGFFHPKPIGSNHTFFQSSDRQCTTSVL